MENAQILPGALEKSNVDLLKGMGEMIRIERTFELQKTAADVILKELRKTITELPKPV
jgi:flagellar basal body rod protein FlgG